MSTIHISYLRHQFMYFYTLNSMPSALFDSLEDTENSAAYYGVSKNKVTFYELRSTETYVGSGIYKPSKISFIRSYIV